MEIFHETKIKPIDAEIQKLLDASPPVIIDHSILKIKDSDDYSATGSDPRLGLHPGYTGFAFSSEEKLTHKTPAGQQTVPQRNTNNNSQFVANRQLQQQQQPARNQNQGYANIMTSPDNKSQQISNDQSYGSPESSFASPQSHKQNRLNNVNNRPKGH